MSIDKISEKTVNHFTVETYHINEGLRLCLAYDLSTTSHLIGNGGLRWLTYSDVASQESEALILAKHMTQKHTLYHTGFAGAKLVAHGECHQENRKDLLNAVASILNDKQGRIYTGCDMNINNQDMCELNTLTPYILNSHPKPEVDTSIATAFGVYGSLMSVMQSQGDEWQNKTFLVHGLGKIGQTIAKKLIAEGHRVMTYDINKSNAYLPQAMNISGNPQWYQLPCDYLILCSASHIIHEDMAVELQCKAIVSSANAPFSSENVSSILKEKYISWIPDVVSNAGAVICDYLEHYQIELYKKMSPEAVYNYVYERIHHKTQQLIQLANQYSITPAEALDIFLNINVHQIKLPKAA